MPKQRIRDPLHNLIEFETGEEFEFCLWRVIQTREFQRLRRIKQLGFSELVYPGATHSRFAHSVGVFHTARQLIEVIRRHTQRVEDSKVREALAAALVHDLGHGPFSHAFESVGKRLGLNMADHEVVSDALIRDSKVAEILRGLGSGFANDVADVIRGRGNRNIYRAVVSSQFDADRLDYMRRDRLMAGTQHAAVDFQWLLANLEVGNVPYGVDQEQLGEVETFVLGSKAIYAAERFVLGLFQLYPTVYLHKATRGAEKLYTELICRIVELIRQGLTSKTGLPSNHPLVRFAERPDDLETALSLDDSVIWGGLCLMMDAEDRGVAEAARRLHDRNLYKCFDVRTMLTDPANSDPAYEIELERSLAEIKEKLTTWSAENSRGIPRILIDQATRSLYRPLEESKGPLDQINIRTPNGDLVDLSKRSPVVGALQIFRLFRVYVSREDREAASIVETTIKEGQR